MALDPNIPAPANAFASAKVQGLGALAGASGQAMNAHLGANGSIANLTTNPTGATGPQPAKFLVAGGNGIVGSNATANNVFQDRFAPVSPVAPAQLAPAGAGAAAGNRVLLAGGGIHAGREAYLRGSQQAVDAAGNAAMTREQAHTNMILAHMAGLLPDQQEEDTTPAPTTVGESKAYQAYGS